MEKAQELVDLFHSKGGAGFTPWESDFIESLEERLDAGKDLSDPELDKAEEVLNERR